MFNGTCGITTTHHDKPAESRLSMMAQKMKKEEGLEKIGLNVTLPLSERQKRLLPYMTFYLGQDYNRPRSSNKPNYVSIAQHPQQQQQKGERYYNYQTDAQKELVDSKTKFTPFLESNALPGPFLPMLRNQPVKERQHVNVNLEKLPNYSAIYDKLSQIKLQQQNNLRYKTIEYVPTQNAPYKPNYSTIRTEGPFKLPQNTNTIIQSYTPTNIDIPQYDYQEIPPAPPKNYGQHPIKYVQEQYPVQTQEYAGEHKQYNRGEYRRPVFVYRPKPQKEIAYIPQVSNNNKHPVIYVENVPDQHRPIYVDSKPNRPILLKKHPIVLEKNQHQTHPVLYEGNPPQTQPYPIFVGGKQAVLLQTKPTHQQQLHQVLVQSKHETSHPQQTHAPVFIEPIYVDNKPQPNHPVLVETKPIYVKETNQAYPKETLQQLYSKEPQVFPEESHPAIYPTEMHQSIFSKTPAIYAKDAYSTIYPKESNPQIYIKEAKQQIYNQKDVLQSQQPNYQEQQQHYEQVCSTTYHLIINFCNRTF